MKIYKLRNDFKYLGKINYVKYQEGAVHIPFEDEKDISFFMSGIEKHKLPEKICFGADFNVIPKSDFPINSLLLNILSKKMLSILNELGNFKHTLVPIVFFNHKELEAYHIEEGIGLDDLRIKNNDYIALQLLEYIDAFNKEKSVFEEHYLYPEKVGSIRELVLKEPLNGFPPIFKIEEDSTLLFITEEAKSALESAGVKGCEFEEVEVSS
ncbi:hypothetical protein ABGT15_04860 [Flavobacterium enshiense]|uniref:hypothetical protein n=1 Tax=Flavobacterium enshiense TaxID=1341165 RepID=UPI00345D2B81